jgi:3-oxoacyl-[acyl-carrier protein] reductase
VVITYNNPDSSLAVEELISKITALNNGAKAASVRADLQKPESAAEIVKATLEAFPPSSEGEKAIDILVNNAAIVTFSSVTEITPEDFAYVYDVNVRAPILLVAAVLPYLRRPGRIINITSPAASFGFENLLLYGSSKSALEGLTRCMAVDLGKEGHIVNAVMPGVVQTDMLDQLPRAVLADIQERTPLEQKVGTVEEVSDVVATMAEHSTRFV